MVTYSPNTYFQGLVAADSAPSYLRAIDRAVADSTSVVSAIRVHDETVVSVVDAEEVERVLGRMTAVFDKWARNVRFASAQRRRRTRREQV